MNSQRQKSGSREARARTREGRRAWMPVRGFGSPQLHSRSGRTRLGARISCVIVLLFVCNAGCVSRSRAKLDAQGAYLEGRQKALAEQQAQQPAVWFRGDIRNPRVEWTENLTLSQALLSAHYTWNWDPRLITVTRDGEVHQVNARRLLRGEDDPVLKPGDVIEVRH